MLDKVIGALAPFLPYPLNHLMDASRFLLRRCYLIHVLARFQRCALIMTRVMVQYIPLISCALFSGLHPTCLSARSKSTAQQRHRNRPQLRHRIDISFDQKSNHENLQKLLHFCQTGPADYAYCSPPWPGRQRFPFKFYVLRLPSINPWLVLV